MTEPRERAAGPVFWPRLTAAEAELEWPALRDWVAQLGDRFPRAVRMPACWWQHNDLVELLAALRDHERACFGPSAPATAAVDWQRAFRDVELRLEMWIKRLGCTVPGREHTRSVDEAGWTAFVATDLAHRAVQDSKALPSTWTPPQ